MLIKLAGRFGSAGKERGLIRVPATTQTLDDRAKASVLKLIAAIEDLDDVDAVYTTLEHDGEALAVDA